MKKEAVYLRIMLIVILAACFFVLVTAAKAAAGDFILSGGPNKTDNFCVDDDIYVYLDGNLIYKDIDLRRASCNNQPINFQAETGAALRVVAIDSVGICRGIGPLWLHYGDQSLKLDSGNNDGCVWGPVGMIFYDKTFIIPQLVEPEPDPVIIVPGIMGSWNVSGKWELDPLLHTYNNLWQALKNAGYEEGKTLFAFPYEWRQDNTLTAYQLKQKINEIKNIRNCGKVDVVAHSMGGLVARYYAESDYYDNDIDQLVFLGAPHKGSPKSYLTWEGASGFFGPKEWIMKQYFNFEAHARGYETLFNYIHDYVKSVEQLLPDYAYLQNAGGTSLRIYDQASYPDNYPYNTFLENLNSAENLEKLTNSGINIFNITGNTGDNTIGVIKLSSGENYWPAWKHGYAEELIKFAGDNTVPDISSSLFIPTKINGADHLWLPSKAQKEVVGYLTGALPAIDITDMPEPEKVLVVAVYSPVDFVIISPNGKKLGKDFLSGENINEIKNAFYTGFQGETEFAVIVNPEKGDYRVELIGTGNGTYGLGVDIIGEMEEKRSENLIPGIISAGDKEIFEFNYFDNNGTFEIIIQKEINIEDLGKDLDELYEAGEIKERQAYNYLSAKSRKLNEIYGKIEDKKDEEKRKQDFIKESEKIIEKLEFYLEKNRLTQTAFSILTNNINYLRENL